MIALDSVINKLMDDIGTILGQHTEGMSEPELLTKVRKSHDGYQELFDTSGELGLFKSHFLLMHVLYRLRQQWQQEKIADLEIQALMIRRWPFAEFHGDSLNTLQTDTTPAKEDKLASYYLDLNHYHETSSEDVKALLNGFWEKYLAQDEKHQALIELELEASATLEEAKKQYKRLAMLHHPDRGGCGERFKKLSAAMDTLTICLK